jgi:hypothetical protein
MIQKYRAGTTVYLTNQLDRYAQTPARILAYDYTSQPRCYLIRFADGDERWISEAGLSLSSA